MSETEKVTEELEDSAVADETSTASVTTTAPDEAGDEAPVLTLEEQLAAAEAKAAEYLDGWQRAQAEFANARKRFDRLRKDSWNNAQADIATQILPVIDDFARAIENAPPEIEEHSWFEGIELVNRKLSNILEKIGIVRIDAVGHPFDPNYHEAITKQDSDEYESGTVIQELQVGFRLGTRVIRPALVVVAA